MIIFIFNKNMRQFAIHSLNRHILVTNYHCISKQMCESILITQMLVVCDLHNSLYKLVIE